MQNPEKDVTILVTQAAFSLVQFRGRDPEHGTVLESHMVGREPCAALETITKMTKTSVNIAF